MIQDNSREDYLVKLFGLEGNSSRIGWDARDQWGNEYEIKTTTKGTVSTARDLGYSHLDKWSKRFWIVARGQQESSGFVYHKIYFLDPQQMSGWIGNIRSRLDEDMKIVNATYELVDVFLDDVLKKRAKKILEDGIKLNDPGISWKYIESNGTLISSDYAGELQKLVAQYSHDRTKNERATTTNEC